MIRTASHEGRSGSSFSYHDALCGGPGERGLAKKAATPDRLGSAAPADRFCAWAGRSGRRLVFTVIRLDPDQGAPDLPRGPGVLVLAVRRPASGPRRVLWAASVETEAVAAAVRSAAQALATAGGGELHCRVASDLAEAYGLAAEFEPRL